MPSQRRNRAGSRPTTAFMLAVLSVALFAAGFVFIGFYVESVNGPHLRYLGTCFLIACAVFVIGCMIGLIVGIPRFVSSGALRHDMEARRVAARTTAAATAAVAAAAGAPAASPPATTGDPGSADPGSAAPDSADSSADTTDQPAQVSSSQLTPSTNLAEISDWLTKLLLGAGLVELTRLGHPLSALVNAVARATQDIPPGAKPPQGSLVMAAGLLALYVTLGFLDGYVITTLWYGSYLERLDSD